MTAPVSLFKQRVYAAIRGAFVADAASMGTHWEYDPAKMLETVLDVNAPEFRDPPSPKFYSAEEFPGHYGSGMLSPYGEQLLFVTEYVASTTKQDFTGEAMSLAMLDWARTFEGRPDHALTTFIENMNKEDNSGKWPECGADDDQAHIYMKIVPVTCRYAGSPELVEKITEAIKVHQNNQKAIAFGITSARILEAVLLGAPLQEALATVETNLGDDLKSSDFQQDVQTAFTRGKKGGEDKGKTLDELLLEVSHEMMHDKPESPFYNFAARSCALPGSFIGPLALFYKSTLVGKDAKETFVSAIRENILASGDTCSRGVFIGAVLGASGVTTDGNSAIPSDWIEKMDKTTMVKVDGAIEKIAE